MRPGVGALLGAVLVLVPCMLPGPALGSETYATVKRALYDRVFAHRRETLYCACPFDADRRPELGACGYGSEKTSRRAGRIEVEHVVPASWIGRGRACWRSKICRDARGVAFKGRKCCLAIDPAFRRAFQDLHNLWPTIGAINERRSNYAFGLIEGERRAFGRCDFEVDSKARLVEPRPAVRGDVARISLYMADSYGIHLNDAQRRLFESWNREDPPDTEERHRHEIILRLQGRRNPWMSQARGS